MNKNISWFNHAVFTVNIEVNGSLQAVTFFPTDDHAVNRENAQREANHYANDLMKRCPYPVTVGYSEAFDISKRSPIITVN